MEQTLIDLFWKEMKQTGFFSSVTLLQKDTEGGMLPLGKWKRVMYILRTGSNGPDWTEGIKFGPDQICLVRMCYDLAKFVT